MTVPNAWNATDESDASFLGGVGWYRKDFRLPRGGPRSAVVGVRFESVNYRSRVWLNGRPIGTQPRRLPAVRDPPAGVGRCAAAASTASSIRVDNRRKPTDFPPSGLSAAGRPDRRLVELRRPAARGLPAARSTTSTSTPRVVRPNLPCATCAATVDYRVTLRNYGDRARRVAVTGRFGEPAASTSAAPSSGRDSFATVHAPHHGPPPAAVVAGRPRALRRLARRALGRPRAAALHAADRHPLDQGRRRRPPAPQRPAAELPRRGAARGLAGQGLRDRQRATATRRSLWLKELGATVIRSHYPLHPYFQEQADRAGDHAVVRDPGLLGQDAVPRAGPRPPARRPRARDNILTNGNHPSVIVWSIGNELSARPGPVQGYYIRARGDGGQARWTRRAPSASPSPATRRSAASASTRRSTSSASTSTSAGTRAGRPDRRPHAAARSTSTRSAPATRARRSSSPSSAPRPTATARSRRRARTPSSRTS